MYKRYINSIIIIIIINVIRDYSNSFVSLKSGDHVRAQHVPVNFNTLPFTFYRNLKFCYCTS